jgi:DNA modification methylase
LIIYKSVKGVRYIYYRFWDPETKKRVDIYCGKGDSVDANKRAHEAEKLYLKDKMDGLRLKLREHEEASPQPFDSKGRAYKESNGQLSLRKVLSIKTKHKIIIDDSTSMDDVETGSVQLVLGSPPYFNAPFDYPGAFKDWKDYQQYIENYASEIYRVLEPGRIAAIVCDDIITEQGRFPVVAEITRAFTRKESQRDFLYRDTIIWKKPTGYIRKSRRSGVAIQNPYPMYFYTDNITETILVFQKKGYKHREYSEAVKQRSKIDLAEFFEKNLYLNVWEITNVLPKRSRIEREVAAFPYEIPYRLIKLYSFVGETVLDPWLGSGTSMKAAIDLCRNSIGYEINSKLREVILQRIGAGLVIDPTRLEISITEGGKTQVVAR